MPRFIACLCLLLLAMALAMTWRGRSPLTPEPPQMPSRPIVGLSAALAPIGPLEEFLPNEDNPFVPSGQGCSRQHDEGSTATPPDIDDGEAGGDALPLPPIVRRGRSIDAESPPAWAGWCMARVAIRP